MMIILKIITKIEFVCIIISFNMNVQLSNKKNNIFATKQFKAQAYLYSNRILFNRFCRWSRHVYYTLLN